MLNLKSSFLSASRSRSETRRTQSPTMRAAAYMDSAFANPSPDAKSSRRRVITDWVRDRFPLVRMTKALSPGRTNVCILGHTFTWSDPALVLESDAMTRPCRVMMPRQFVIFASPTWMLEHFPCCCALSEGIYVQLFLMEKLRRELWLWD